MMRRITLKTPIYDHVFNIQNGNLQQRFTWWYFKPSYEAICQMEDLGIESNSPKLDSILRQVGSYATLWIGSWKGRLAPMDVVPHGGGNGIRALQIQHEPPIC